jgi:DNA polymerase III delta prime subunit
MGEYLWTEIYRPSKIEDCILPARIKDSFLEYVKQGKVPNLMLTGGPGIGKTTSAIAMCEEIGLSYMMINASNENGIDVIRTKIINYASTLSLTGGRKVIILDEADNLTAANQSALRGTIEEFSNNCSFILTCNFKAKIMDAIHSRMAVIDFNLSKDEKAQMATMFFKRLKNILTQENVEFDSKVLAEIISRYFPDYRRTLGELQRLAVTGKIDSNTLTQLSDVRNIKELMSFLKDKNFREVRKWVVDNSDVDMPRLYRAIYDALAEFLKPSSIPVAIIIIAKYQYQNGFVADTEINLVACLTEIMVECEFE